MKRLTQIFFIFLFFLLPILGCSSSSNGMAPSSSPDPRPQPGGRDDSEDEEEEEKEEPQCPLNFSSEKRPPSALTKELADVWLQASCEQVGAEYIQGKHLCLCPPGNTFHFWVDWETGEPNAKCEEVEFRFKKLEEGGLSFSLRNSLKKLETGFVVSTSFLQGQDDSLLKSLRMSLPSDQAPGTLTWTSPDILKAFLKGQIPNPYPVPGFFQFDGMDFFVDSYGRRAERVTLPHPGAPRGRGFSITSEFFLESSLDHLKESLTGMRHKTTHAEVFFHPSLQKELSFGLYDHLNQIVQLIRREVPEEEYVPHSQYGCAEYCEFFREWKPSNGRGSIRWEKSYLSGAVYENRIFLLEDRGKVAAQFFLTPIDDLSILVVHTYPSEKMDEKRRWLRKDQFFDRGGDLIFENPVSKSFNVGVLDEIPPDDLKYIHSMEYVLKKDSVGSRLPQLVVCESGFPMTKKDDDEIAKEYHNKPLFPHLLLGPHLQSSFFGWLKEGFNLDLHRFSGTSRQSFFAPGWQYLEGDLYHTTTVSLAVLQEWQNQERQGAIVPMGIYECTHHAPLWTKEVFQAGVRVVNISSGRAFDSEACQQSAYYQGIVNSPLLWVSAGGNGAERVSLKQSYGCPHNVGVLENLLIAVTGYSHRGPIADSATYGEEIGDIVANGQNPKNQNQYMSSYAAPRVAAVAAQLAAEFPELSPPQIRLAILLGAFVPIQSNRPEKNAFMEVRTGGGLDLGLARRAATILSRTPTILETKEGQIQALMKVHCLETGKDSNLFSKDSKKSRSSRFKKSSDEEEEEGWKLGGLGETSTPSVQACRARMLERHARLVRNGILKE